MNYKILINKDHKISKQDLNNIQLISVKDCLKEDTLIERKTYFMYQKLKEFLSTIGIEIGICSAYRKIEEQIEIREAYKNKYGEEYVKEYVAPEGYSEHHTGLAIDLSLKIKGEYLVRSEDLMKEEKTFQEIFPYLKEYGFILRYPKEKEKITGYSYEPWHIRYVGRRTAEKMIEENLTLEEYHNKYNRSGILLVNKPSGITSREVDEIIGKKFDTKKVGHTGTLDPLASGLLIVTLNKATKISSEIVSGDKEYIATAKIGIRTDTLDVTGQVVEEKKVEMPNIKELLKSFEKTYLQEVPIYSAVKVNGKKLYEYARNNKKVELPKKKVTIKSLELLEQTEDTFTFKCKVSKGTYIRSLIRDMGCSIHIPMTMQNLIRVKEAGFEIEKSNTLEEILKDQYQIISIEEALNYKVVKIEGETLKKVKNGAPIPNQYQVEEKVILKQKDQLIALYQTTEDKKTLKSDKMF